MNASKGLRCPRISLVVPAFRAAGTIERTLKSIEAQNYPALQLIVIDGGSKDGTEEILKSYNHLINYWVSEKDKGQVDALNKGFAKANGEIYGWLCADDELMPGALMHIAEKFLRHPEVDVVSGGCRRNFSGNQQVDTLPAPDFLDQLDFKNTIEQPSTFWRGIVHATAGPLDDSYKYAFDWEFWCRLKSAGAVFDSTPKILSVYHFSDENLTSTGGRKIVDEMYRIVKKYGPYDGRIADVYWMLYRYYDLKGYYDREKRSRLTVFQRAHFYGVLRLFYSLFDPQTVNAYNWNFVSRQERGLGW